MSKLDLSKIVKLADGFGKDENGKVWALPMKLPESGKTDVPVSTKKSGDKRRSFRRKFIPIEPLQMNLLDLEEPQNPSKKPKLDRPIRKELFKVPQKKPEKNTRLSVRTIPIIKKPTSTSSKKNTPAVKPAKIFYNDGSPLFDADEAEQLLCKKSRLIEPIKTVLFPMASIKEEFNEFNNDLAHTPQSAKSKDSDQEYLELERQFASARKSAKKNIISPLTSVCTLLENTKIEASGGKKDDNQSNKVQSDILALLQENEEEVALFKQEFEVQIQSITEKFTTCVKQCEKRHKKIVELLTENKENNGSVRRSTRVSTSSPGISKKVDLRKTTLNRNLSKNLQSESPRTRNAVNMYNTVRNDCSVLCTPKIDRLELSENSATRSLSRRIQKQCLLLQDTPKV